MAKGWDANRWILPRPLNTRHVDRRASNMLDLASQIGGSLPVVLNWRARYPSYWDIVIKPRSWRVLEAETRTMRKDLRKRLLCAEYDD